MASLTRERMVREERWTYRLFKLAAGKRAWKGGLAVYDESLAAVIPAESGQEDLFPLGLFYESVDNTAGATPIDVNVRLFRERTLWWFANDLAAAITANDIGKLCYLLDDQTVTITPGSGVLGTIWAVDSAKGVAVEVK